MTLEPDNEDDRRVYAEDGNIDTKELESGNIDVNEQQTDENEKTINVHDSVLMMQSNSTGSSARNPIRNQRHSFYMLNDSCSRKNIHNH